jgi:hypothetical protein
MAALVVVANGCSLRLVEAEAASPVPLNLALAEMQSNLNRVHVVVLSDAQFLYSTNLKDQAAVTRLRDVIAEAQCFSWAVVVDKHGNPILEKDGTPKRERDPGLRTKNPLIPVVTGAAQLTVQGQISTAGTFTISGNPSVGGTATRQAQQQLMVPISLVSLSNIENFYLGQQLANLQYLTLLGPPPFEKSAAPGRVPLMSDKAEAGLVVSSVVAVGANLRSIMTDAFTKFQDDPKYCENRDGGELLTGAGLSSAGLVETHPTDRP